MDNQIGLEEMEDLYAYLRGDHQFRAWLLVNAPAVDEVLDRVPTFAALYGEDLEVFASAYGRFVMTCAAWMDAFDHVRLVLFDQLPSEVLRSSRSLREAWAAAGRDEAELHHVVEVAGPLLPFDHSDEAVIYYLNLHGVAAPKIAARLASWPHQIAA